MPIYSMQIKYMRRWKSKMKKFITLLMVILMTIFLTTTILAGPDWPDEPDCTEYEIITNE